MVTWVVRRPPCFQTAFPRVMIVAKLAFTCAKTLLAKIFGRFFRISTILPSLHNRTHSKVEARGRWSARPKICLIVTVSLQQSG